uniref:Uncharacterized protein n=1 Tax=Arundo donax TaxID=35708 RepID=A0A0A9HKL7_ARUDO
MERTRVRATCPSPVTYEQYTPAADQSALTAKFSLRSWNTPVQVLKSSSNLVSRASKWPEP